MTRDHLARDLDALRRLQAPEATLSDGPVTLGWRVQQARLALHRADRLCYAAAIHTSLWTAIATVAFLHDCFPVWVASGILLGFVLLGLVLLYWVRCNQRVNQTQYLLSRTKVPDAC